MAIQAKLSPEILSNLEDLRDLTKQYGANAHLHYGKIKNFNKNMKYFFNSITQDKIDKLSKKNKVSWLSRINSYIWAPIV